jgi:class 3 adenylate cyclase/tetratricopeptide (TPR) repeat protein
VYAAESVEAVYAAESVDAVDVVDVVAVNPAALTRYSPMAVGRVAELGTAIGETQNAARFLELDGTLVFGDISGFTALSERLAKQGRIGAELINQLLSISFSAMLDTALGLGGDLVSFGGDSLCLLFDGNDHCERGVAAAHGLRAALRRTASIRAPIDKGTLRISTGVHSGPVVLALVGSQNPTLVTLGPTLSCALALEARAEGGEVFISPEVHERLIAGNATWAVTEERVENIRALTSLRRRVMPWMNAEPVMVADDGLEVFGIDPAIRTELRSGRSGLEHHPATIAFLHYEGVDRLIEEHGAKHAVRVLDRLMTNVQVAAESEGVTILATDVDSDGGKIVLAAGIPRSAGLEHDRMLATVRRVLDSDNELPIRIGVHAGTVFAGPVGSRERASYTTLGDVVNTTARIMAKAQIGEALISPVVLQGSRTPWSATEVAPFAAKGKSVLVRASALGSPQSHAPKNSGPTHLPFRGRVAELAQIERAIETFRQGKPAIVELVGDGGLGKSRLVEESLWRLGDLRVIHINGSPFARTQGYFALQTELRLAVGLHEDADVAEGLRHVVRTYLPKEEPLLPLIGAAFGCEFEETKESKGVAEQFRARRTNQLVVELLDQIVGRSGVVLVVDDSYWLDEATCSLIDMLIDDPDRTWFYLSARRPEPTHLDLSARSGLLRIELEQLDDESALALAESFAVDHPISEEVLRSAAARSGGNPLLLELILEALREGASINDLPEEAERLVAARFDSLSGEGRDLLRAAAVLGMDVSSALLARLLDTEIHSVERRISAVAEYLIPESVGAYRFRHALVRDTAYLGLAFSARKRLHASVVEAIEEGVTHVGETVSLLAVHAVAATMHDRIWRYARQATEVARRRGLLAQAAELSMAALSASRYVEVLDDEIADVCEALGDVQQLGGRPLEAQKAFSAGLKKTTRHDHRRVLKWKRAESQVVVQKYRSADMALDEVLTMIGTDRSKSASRLRAEVLRTKAVIPYRRGNNAAAVRLLNEAWAAAERSEDTTVKARINYLYGAVETALGSRHAEFYIHEAVRLLRSEAGTIELARALGNLGYFQHFNGFWGAALSSYEESARVADSVGDVLTAANARNNIGEILSDRGELDGAERRFLSAQRAWSSLGYSIGVALSYSNLGRVAMRKGEFAAARNLLDQSVKRFTDIGDGMFVQETQARIIECDLFENRLEHAIQAGQLLLKPVRQSGQNPLVETSLLRIIGAAQAALGLPEESAQTLIKALSLAEAFRGRYEELLIVELLADNTAVPNDQVGDYRDSAKRLREGLGVVSPMRQTLSANSMMIDLSAR